MLVLYQLIPVPVAERFVTLGAPHKDWAKVVGAAIVPQGLIEKSLIPIPSSLPVALISSQRIQKKEPAGIFNPVKVKFFKLE